MAEDQNTTDDAYRVQEQPLLTKVKHGAAVFAIQNLLVGPANFVRSVKAYVAPPENRPALVKTIFFPKEYDTTSKDQLPVLFTIHGGGFVLGSPTDNDDWNQTYASQHHCVVIGLNYGKAPGNPFPKPVYDCEALFLAALNDQSLPLDRTRVALLGWSAGGNLTLAISQLETVRKHLTCIVALYPPTDFSTKGEDKVHSRQYKPDLGGDRGKDRDYLLSFSAIFDWAYQVPGGNSRDPLLSPCFASKDALPKRVFVISCELDMLAGDGQKLIHKLAGRPPPPATVGKRETAGEKGALIFDDERFHFEVSDADGSAYRWLLVPDTVHGFDQHLEGVLSDPELLEDARIKMQKTIKIIGEWVLQAPPISAAS
ncbi:alpha/beta-hydrolase [Colletotrichum falcatum]|nr:alpha/beta-hydrolase [Colletotrichum falcatum]